MNREELKSRIGQRGKDKFLYEFLLCNSYDKYFYPKDRDLLWSLKKDFSKAFGLCIREIEIAGSAKIGISYNKGKYNKRFDENSDIDIIIVSSSLFDNLWLKVVEFDKNNFKLDESERINLNQTLNYINEGIISPDKLPLELEPRKEIWDIFEKFSGKPEYDYRKVRGRIFKNWFFVERYYLNSFHLLEKEIQKEKNI